MVLWKRRNHRYVDRLLAFVANVEVGVASLLLSFFRSSRTVLQQQHQPSDGRKEGTFGFCIFLEILMVPQKDSLFFFSTDARRFSVFWRFSDVSRNVGMCGQVMDCAVGGERLGEVFGLGS